MKRTGYMCTTDFQYELGCNIDGSRVFPSIESLRDALDCWPECGIVRVEVTLAEDVVGGTE